MMPSIPSKLKSLSSPFAIRPSYMAIDRLFCLRDPDRNWQPEPVPNTKSIPSKWHRLHSPPRLSVAAILPPGTLVPAVLWDNG
eukprot:scaffold37526_cov59-Cyclotella_meneghiniana.AAC.5